MGIAQIALDPHPLCKTGKREKKCPKPSWQAYKPPLPPPYTQYPYGGNAFQKGASLIKVFFNNSYHQGFHLEIGLVCWKSGMQLSLLSK